MTRPTDDPLRFVEAIRRKKLSIYDAIEIGDPELWIPTRELEILLDDGLRGLDLAGLPNRTRSKVAKEHVCRVLGYAVPPSFKKTQPRFQGQFFDTYVQKSNNLQVWNEELAPTRRYVIIRVSEASIVCKVKVVTGETLSRLDTTGTLTQKYQARLDPGTATTELISEEDTAVIKPLVQPGIDLKTLAAPVDDPVHSELLPIKELFERLKPLIAQQFPDRGHDQERNRGADLHRLICQFLGYADYSDNGQFPDIRHQLLEVKLQTSPTIDLGLVCPDSTEALDVVRPWFGGHLKMCAIMRKEVSYDEEEIQTIQSGVQAARVETCERRWCDGQGRMRGTGDQSTSASPLARSVSAFG